MPWPANTHLNSCAWQNGPPPSFPNFTPDWPCCSLKLYLGPHARVGGFQAAVRQARQIGADGGVKGLCPGRRHSVVDGSGVGAGGQPGSGEGRRGAWVKWQCTRAPKSQHVSALFRQSPMTTRATHLPQPAAHHSTSGPNRTPPARSSVRCVPSPAVPGSGSGYTRWRKR